MVEKAEAHPAGMIGTGSEFGFGEGNAVGEREEAVEKAGGVGKASAQFQLAGGIFVGGDAGDVDADGVAEDVQADGVGFAGEAEMKFGDAAGVDAGLVAFVGEGFGLLDFAAEAGGLLLKLITGRRGFAVGEFAFEEADLVFAVVEAALGAEAFGFDAGADDPARQQQEGKGQGDAQRRKKFGGEIHASSGSSVGD